LTGIMPLPDSAIASAAELLLALEDEEEKRRDANVELLLGLANLVWEEREMTLLLALARGEKRRSVGVSRGCAAAVLVAVAPVATGVIGALLLVLLLMRVVKAETEAKAAAAVLAVDAAGSGTGQRERKRRDSILYTKRFSAGSSSSCGGRCGAGEMRGGLCLCLPMIVEGEDGVQ